MRFHYDKKQKTYTKQSLNPIQTQQEPYLPFTTKPYGGQFNPRIDQ